MNKILFWKSSKFSIILFFLVWAVFYSLSKSIHLDPFHIDGFFQTASSLYRLHSGQLPGRDFFPYLGIGPILLLYPAFKILGANLMASNSSAHVMTLLAGQLTVSILWQLVFRPKSFATSLAVGAFFSVVYVMLLHTLAIPGLELSCFIFSPGNSLKPIRSLPPYILATLYYFFITHTKRVKPNGPTLLKGFIAGSAMCAMSLWSNDYAIPSIGLFGVLFGLDSLINNRPHWKKNCLIAGCIWILFIISIIYGPLFGLAKYNFLDVARDQWWFFGPYYEHSRIFKLGQLHRLITLYQSLIPFIILLFTLIIALKTKKIEHILISWIGLVLFTGGSLASIGGHFGSYFIGFQFWALLLLIFGLLKGILLINNRTIKNIFYILKKISLKFIILFLFVETVYVYIEYRNLLISHERDSSKFYVTEFGLYLNSEWKEYIDFSRENREKNVIEEYWGLWSALNRSFPEWPVDSSIHALGKVRKRAKESLSRADIIISTRYKTSTTWQPWNLTMNFWFYDELISRWEPKQTSPYTLIWEKRKTPRIFQESTCEILRNKKGFTLKSDKKGLYRINIHYQAPHYTGIERFLLMIKNNISYVAGSNGYASLNPKEISATFPLRHHGNAEEIYDLKVIGGKYRDAALNSCSAWFVKFYNKDVFPK